MGVEPTNDSAFTSGCPSSRSTATLSPWTMLNTPLGSPASSNSSAATRLTLGSFSEGFNTNVLPAAMAFGYIHMGTIDGKLNGVMPATTPRGCRTENTSMSVDTSCEKDPLRCSASPHAYSMFSMPRCTSPAESERTLPCSAVSKAAMSSFLWTTRSRNLYMIAVRLAIDVAAQSSNASAAAPTARSTSSTLASPTNAVTSPVAGLWTGLTRPDVEVTSSPAITWLMVRMGRFLL
jgi:hypothetical protein